MTVCRVKLSNYKEASKRENNLNSWKGSAIKYVAI